MNARRVFGSAAAFLAAFAAHSLALAQAGAEPKPRSQLSLQVQAGANYAKFFSVPTYGGELSFALGDHKGDNYYLLGLSLERGRTEHGLDLSASHLMGIYDRQLGIVRLGGALRVGYMNVDRVTRGYMDSGSIGGALRAGLDFARLSRQTQLYLQSEMRVDSYGEAWVLNPNLALGIRWEPKGRL